MISISYCFSYYWLILCLVIATVSSSQAQNGNATFVTTWYTGHDGVSAPSSIEIPVDPDHDYLYDVDWDNDGIFDEENVTGSISHDYGLIDTVTVSIRGRFPRFHFDHGGDVAKLISVDRWHEHHWADMKSMFAGAIHLTIIPLEPPILTGITDLSYLFADCSSFNRPLFGWEVGEVKDMSFMLAGATAFNQSLGYLDVHQVSDMTSILDHTAMSTENFDHTLLTWYEKDISNVAVGAEEVKYCKSSVIISDFLGPFFSAPGAEFSCDDDRLASDFVMSWYIDDNDPTHSREVTIPTHPAYSYNYDVDWDNDGIWDDIGVTGDIAHTYQEEGYHRMRIRGDFPAIYFNGEGSAHQLSSVDQWGDHRWESMEHAFHGCKRLHLITRDVPDISSVESYSYMFAYCEVLDDAIPLWHIDRYVEVDYMYYHATAFNKQPPFSNFFIISASHMFAYASSFNQDVSSYILALDADISYMFAFASSYDQDLSGWDLSNVTHMQGLLEGAVKFNSEVKFWDVSRVVDLRDVFKGCTSFNRSLGTWKLSAVQTMEGMLDNCGISRSNYDLTLIGWANESSEFVIFTADGLLYCEAEEDRNKLIEFNHWTISGDTLDCVTSTDDQDIDGQIKMYPNPTQQITFVNIDNAKQDRVYLEVYDTRGIMIQKSQHLGASEHITSAVDFPSAGIYFVHIRVGNRYSIKKIVVLSK